MDTEKIRQSLVEAKQRRELSSMFTLEVLRHAEHMMTRRFNGLAFCKKVGVSDSYEKRLREALSLYRTMKDQGYIIVLHNQN